MGGRWIGGTGAPVGPPAPAAAPSPRATRRPCRLPWHQDRATIR